MQRQLLLYIVGLVAVIGGFFIWYSSSSNRPQAISDGSVILYYSDTCPHCKKVEAFIIENQVMKKYPILQRKEAQINQDNQNEMINKGNICGISRNQLGFPLLWNGSDCITGDVSIIEYLKEKI
ncbi:MAG: hypothetical protein Q7S24_01145 [bacterium]|nr:hypothetical protein [bacterium]